MPSATLHPGPTAAPRPAAPLVEVVVPVHDEAGTLEASVRRLHRFLSAELPLSWSITVADNASRDATPAIAARLAAELRGVRHLRIEAKGRGRALRTAWSASPAPVLAYMDVDLSTDLRALLPLVAPLLSGHSDVAIGSRLAPGARVVRGPRRELISRSYNLLLHGVLRARFTDAQCGFKAVRADALSTLLPDVRDQDWFFDTELLVLAQRRGLRIHEVPVDWVDDPHSTVRIAATAWQDLKGVGRLLAAGPVARFAAVGVLCTVAYALLFLLLRATTGPVGANAIALALTAVANTAANRRLTFGVRGRRHLARHHTRGALVYLLTLGLTSGALGVLHGLDAAPARPVELAVLVGASLVATVTRYVALKTWVFARRRPCQGTSMTTLPTAPPSTAS